MDSFKGNSNAEKLKNNKDQILKREITPVTKNVVVKKESELKKFTKQFISEDSKLVKGHVLTNVIIPGIQHLLSDVIKNTVDGLIYGTKNVRTDQRGGISNVLYSSYYNRASGSTGYPVIPKQTANSRSSVYSVNDVTFANRGEAEEVLYRLREAIERYGMASVSDFYDLISQSHAFTDSRYGWRDLKEASIDRVRDGYSISFPKIAPLE